MRTNYKPVVVLFYPAVIHYAGYIQISALLICSELEKIFRTHAEQWAVL
jgi:hypothetical protein